MYKYNLAVEYNPLWQLVEPILFKTWAQGIRRASYKQLYLVHVLSLLTSTVVSVAYLALRAALIAVILLLGYWLFPEPMILAFQAVLVPLEITPNTTTKLAETAVWPYQLLGYVILVKSILFVFGRNFSDWIRDSALHMLIMVTGMLPLKWIARGLLNDNIIAQYLANTSFMGTHILVTIEAAPPEIKRQFNRIFDLYFESNREDKRKELEQICATQIT